MRADKIVKISMYTVLCAGFLAGTVSAGTGRAASPRYRIRSASGQTEKKYKLFCVNGKIEVGSHDISEMKAARGTKVCEIGAYDTFSQAIEASKRLGGVGAPCPCTSAQ